MSDNPSLTILSIGKQTIENELFSLKNLAHGLTEDFSALITKILASNGRIIISGIGKSAIIAQKIVATLNSTGQPALFLHAADAIHGDLGMIQPSDIAILISKSGNTSEIKTLVPIIKNFGTPMAAIVGNNHSYLAQEADFVLDTTIDKEACPNNLAPTTSTTAQLLMGDAIAVTLLQLRNFTANDFSKFHPGGALGKQLYLTCGQLAAANTAPKISANALWKEVVLTITQSRLGATVVVNNENEVIGIVTDGDIRRMLEQFSQFNNIHASDIMGNNPTCLDENTLAIEAAQIMQQKKITQIPITKNNLYFGIVHLHDLYREGII
ncbi:MAG: SIS domain-containing protein [Bacteroidota bacterium]